ncbi:MAG: hypothetical protein K2X87_01045 [Gemmataceae bacterium]|nr:hypothetical protein [Gemmataceae bacterium]
MRPKWMTELAGSTARRLLRAATAAAVVVVTAGVASAADPGVPDDAVPEINPGVMAAAATLVAGGLMVIRDRFRGR